jgi:hypothetical protein
LPRGVWADRDTFPQAPEACFGPISYHTIIGNWPWLMYIWGQGGQILSEPDPKSLWIEELHLRV